MHTDTFLDHPILIIGGTSGIGAAATRHLLAAGRRVLAISRSGRNAAAFEASLPESCRDLFRHIRADVADKAERQALFAGADVPDALSGLVHCEGTADTAPFAEGDEEEWARVVSECLLVPMTVDRLALPRLARCPGSGIVHVSSVCASRPIGPVAYGAAKAALSAYSARLAVESAPLNVRSNAIEPGFIPTGFHAAETGETLAAELLPSHPLGRLGVPADAGAAIAFLLSSQASWITGAKLAVDGGRALV